MTPINPSGGRPSDNHEILTPTQDPRLQELPPDLATESPPAEPDRTNPFHPENLPSLDQSYLEQPVGRKVFTTVEPDGRTDRTLSACR